MRCDTRRPRHRRSFEAVYVVAQISESVKGINAAHSRADHDDGIFFRLACGGVLDAISYFR